VSLIISSGFLLSHRQESLNKITAAPTNLVTELEKTPSFPDEIPSADNE
jgi:hypothetical protein